MKLNMILVVLLSLFAFNTNAQTIVLDFKDSATPQQILDFEQKYGITTRLNSIYSDAAEIRTTNANLFLLERFKSDPLIETAEESHVYSIPENEITAINIMDSSINEFTPNDPKYKFQWHMKNVRMPEAWKMKGGTGKGIIVAVIDTGVAYEDYKNFKQVEDLAKTCFVPGYDFVNDSPHANDDHAHGTHVAGTIAQSTNNNIGVTGIAYESCIMPIKVLAAQGGGTTADIADGIRFAADNGAKVINMSLGGPFPSGVMKDAVAYAISKGVIVVAAAGNDGKTKVGYPAAYEGVIAVSATDASNAISWYSTTGEDIDIAAPGGDTRSDKNGDGVPDGVVQNTITPNKINEHGYFPFQGTSMATPHVAGAVACILASGVKNPKKATEILYASANRKVAEEHGAPKGEKWDSRYGHGLLDVAAALQLASKSDVNHSSLLQLDTISGILDEFDEWMMFLALSLSVLILLGVNHVLTNQNKLDERQKTTSVIVGSVLASAVFGFLSGGNAFDDSWLVSVLFLSAIIPVGLACLWNQTSFRASIAGIALTFTGILLYQSIENTNLIFSSLLLDKIWLLGNAAICFFFGFNSLKK